MPVCAWVSVWWGWVGGCLHMCLSMCTHVSRCLCEGQRTTNCWRLVSPSPCGFQVSSLGFQVCRRWAFPLSLLADILLFKRHQGVLIVPDTEPKGLTLAKQVLYCSFVSPGKSISFKLLNIFSQWGTSVTWNPLVAVVLGWVLFLFAKNREGRTRSRKPDFPDLKWTMQVGKMEILTGQALF